MSRIADLLSRWSVERRIPILVISALLAVFFASQLPKLRVDSSPEALVATVSGQAEVEARFRKFFSGSDTQLVVVVESKDVTRLPVLLYQRDLERALMKRKEVAYVRGLASTTLSPLRDEAAVSAARAAHRAAVDEGERAKAELEQRLSRLPEAVAGPLRMKANEEARKREQEVLGAFEARLRGLTFGEKELKAVVDGDPADFKEGLPGLARDLVSGSVKPAVSVDEAEKSSDAYQDYLVALDQTQFVSPLLLSRDRSAASLVVHFDATVVHDQPTKLAALAAVRAVIDSVPSPKGVEVRLGGAPVLQEAILKKVKQDRLTLNPAMMILCLIVLLATFRWWPAVVAPISAVALAVLAVIGGMALLGQPMTILTNIIPPLLIIVGLSDSVHLIGRYFEELQREPVRVLAGRKAARALISACFMTSLTTAVGFGSLFAARTAELGRFGIVAAIGVIFAYFATILFVPAFITLMRAPRKTDSAGEALPERRGWIESLVVVVTLATFRRVKSVAVAAVVVACGLGLLASRVSADAKLLDAFEEGEEVSEVIRLIQEKLSGIRPLEILIETPDGSLLEPHTIKAVETALLALSPDDVICSTSYIQPLREMRVALTGNGEGRKTDFSSLAQTQALGSILFERSKGALGELLSPDERTGRATVFFADVGIKRTLVVLGEFETRLRKELGPKVHVSFLGEAYVGSVGRDHVLRDLLSGLGLAMVTIFVLLAVVFRSLPLAIAAMPPNIIPLLATGAYMMARGIQLNITTAITFSIGIGLAVDDTLHIVARFREEQRRISSLRVALLRAARGTGTAIFVSGISLALGFSVLMLSEFVSVRQFGELIGVTVVICLISALLFQPALLLLASGYLRGRRP